MASVESDYKAIQNRLLESEKAKRSYLEGLSEDTQKLNQLKRDETTKAEEQFTQVTLVYKRRMDNITNAIQASYTVAEKDRHVHELAETIREASAEYEQILEKLQQLFEETVKRNMEIPLKREVLQKLNRELENET